MIKNQISYANLNNCIHFYIVNKPQDSQVLIWITPFSSFLSEIERSGGKNMSLLNCVPYVPVC